VTDGANILEVKGLNKYFGPTHANVDIDFTIKRGEIKGLIGENGSGKSTLISQIAGIYRYDSGSMTLNGEPYAPHSPKDANREKIAMVMQELGVVGTLPAGVNVFLGRTQQFTKAGFVNLKEVYAAAEKIFTQWDLPMPPLHQLAEGMMVETRKMIELARALSIDPDLLLLDEITQSLSMNNRDRLYGLIGKLKGMGRSVLVITHDVDELIEITDTITVLRDGAVVGEADSRRTTADEIKRMMVGRSMSGEYYREDQAPDYREKVMLTVRDMAVPGEIEDVSFELHEGEILGFCGLSDSGIHSVGKAVYGLSRLSSGSVRMEYADKDVKTAEQALATGAAYVPKDRDSEALMIHASVLDNICLPSVEELEGKVMYLAPGKLRALTNEMVEKFSVRTTGVHQTMDALSGGNKQKINLGRWLAKDLKLLILDCPTRGVDVGVKAYIYSLMKEAKKNGIATLLISDELTEVLGMADRLMVMKDGRITKVIRRDENFTEQSVIGAMI